ncbi:helix-turn-helix domain-containing protein [Mammaliicoccus vitulinus]|uniref:helix-turn-helix domain-containing protein n=1 Tax=Mammaliicoccus vitulinus TaxID=71237 RepID=UPI0039B06AFF
MERAKYVENKIEELGLNNRSFAIKAGISYTTFRSMLERNFEGAKIENVIAVCKTLNISVEYLFNIGTEFEEVQAAHSEEDLTEEELKEIRDFIKKFKS